MFIPIINPVTKQYQSYLRTTVIESDPNVSAIGDALLAIDYPTIINSLGEPQRPFSLLKNDHISTLVQYQSHVFKFSYAKSIREKFKVWFSRDLIRKELDGNKCLRQFGLNVPNIQAAYVNLNPRVRTYGIIAMDWIAESTTLREFWADQDSERRWAVIQQYLDDTGKLLDARIQINDYGPHNILVTSKGELYWLDAVAYKTRLSDSAYFARFSKQIRRVIQSDSPFWTPKEAKYIITFLNNYPLNLQSGILLDLKK